MKSSASARHELKLRAWDTQKRGNNNVDKSERSPMAVATDSDLAQVLGMTVFSNSALTSSPVSGVIAYPAGSVLILLDCVKNKQSSCIICPGKMITALNFSPDGKLLLIGESGHHAAVRVWRMDSMQAVASFGQFCGIRCVSFTPSMREIVVVGNEQDMVITVWSWPKKAMMSLNKFSDNVCAMSVANDGSFFVTVGSRHVKFYYLDCCSSAVWSCPMTLSTKIVLLEDGVDSCLCDIVCGGKDNSFLFAIYSSGLLCQISRSRQLTARTSVEVCGGRTHCLATDDQFVFVGCSGGIIRMFDGDSLTLVATLPLPHSLGVDIAQCSDARKDMLCKPMEEQCIYYPAVKAMVYDKVHQRLAVIYDDCSIYIWYREDNSFKKRYSSLFHGGCIWDFTIYPLPKHEMTCSEGNQGGALPPGSLVTVSADGTLRSWDVSSNISLDSTLKRNPVSSACLKIVYASVYSPCDMEGSKHMLTQIGPSPSAILSRGQITKNSMSKKGRNVLSVVAVCPDGSHIATGNRRGQLTIYDAYTMGTLTSMVAHEAEVTVISYTKSRKYKILASGSRDRMIHLMDACNNYQLMSTLDDHSSTITAIHFTCVSKYLIMVSSSLDMSVLARAYINDRSLSFSHVRAIVEKKAVMDFTLHPWSGQIALVCQDKMVHIKSIGSAQDSYSYRGCSAEGGQLIKINADPSGLYILTACTKKTINLIEFESGEILKTYCGHAETVTRVQFSLNMKYVISSSSDGCIFFWELPVTVAYSVKLVMAEMGLLTRGMVLGEQWKKTPPYQAATTLDAVEEPDQDLFGSVGESSSPPIRVSNSCSMVHDMRECVSQATDYSIRPVKSDSKLRPDLWTCTEYDVLKKHVGSLDHLDELFSKDVRTSNAKKSNLDTWMTTCCKRRELFKLEAKSIKRVLTMMRLVADAMEKDLREPGLLNPKSQDKSPNSQTAEFPSDEEDRDENCNKDATDSGKDMAMTCCNQERVNLSCKTFDGYVASLGNNNKEIGPDYHRINDVDANVDVNVGREEKAGWYTASCCSNSNEALDCYLYRQAGLMGGVEEEEMGEEMSNRGGDKSTTTTIQDIESVVEHRKERSVVEHRKEQRCTFGIVEGEVKESDCDDSEPFEGGGAVVSNGVQFNGFGGLATSNNTLKGACELKQVLFDVTVGGGDLEYGEGGEKKKDKEDDFSLYTEDSFNQIEFDDQDQDHNLLCKESTDSPTTKDSKCNETDDQNLFYTMGFVQTTNAIECLNHPSAEMDFALSEATEFLCEEETEEDNDEMEDEENNLVIEWVDRNVDSLADFYN